MSSRIQSINYTMEAQFPVTAFAILQAEIDNCYLLD